MFYFYVDLEGVLVIDTTSYYYSHLDNKNSSIKLMTKEFERNYAATRRVERAA